MHTPDSELALKELGYAMRQVADAVERLPTLTEPERREHLAALLNALEQLHTGLAMFLCASAESQ